MADAIEPALPTITRETLEAIGREVPEYARPLEGAFGTAVRTGVAEALRQFVQLIRHPDAGRDSGRGVYVALGRGELREGRTLDALLAAYRVGARVAWRQIALAARRAELDAETLSLLAESVFAYIDELSADSAEGYAQARSELEGERQRRRRELLGLLVGDRPAEDGELRVASEAAGWKLPRSAAALACADEDLGRIERRLGTDPLAASIGGIGCIILPDPAGPGRERELAGAVGKAHAAIGPAGDRGRLARSWSLARLGLRVAAPSPDAASGPIRAEDHLAQLLVLDNPRLIELIAERRLGALQELTPRARERMAETALAYVTHWGNAVAMAQAMQVHPQTARYRLARLRELLGDALDDPGARLELNLALRAGGAEAG